MRVQLAEFLLRLSMVLCAMAATLLERPASAADRSSAERIASMAETILLTLSDRSGPSITGEILGNARAIAIFPEISKPHFMLGWRSGIGLLIARTASGAWNGPAFYSIATTSAGSRQDADLLCVVLSDDGLDGFLAPSYKPRGKTAVITEADLINNGLAALDKIDADILICSHMRDRLSRRMFDAATIKPMNKLTGEYYGRRVAAHDILVAGNVAAPVSARRLAAVMAELSAAGEPAEKQARGRHGQRKDEARD